jgi:hypothetical protein
MRFATRVSAMGCPVETNDWECRFKFRPSVVRNHLRLHVNRQCRFSGESFDRIWSHTDRLFGATVSVFLGARPGGQVKVSQLCSDRLRRVLRAAEGLPDSYNKLLIQASAEYCLRVLQSVREDDLEHVQLVTEIRKLASHQQDLLSQYTRGDAATLGLLNLQLTEDRFIVIQEKSERLGLLPRLSEIPVDQLMRR